MTAAPTGDSALRAKLLEVTTATATHLMQLKGYTRCFMEGTRTLQTGVRVVGRAVTVRFGPVRPDLAISQEERQQKEPMWLAIESLQSGDMLIIDCGGDVSGGTTGDILAARVKARGAVGILIDGSVRDSAQVRDLVQIPVWCRSWHGSGAFNTLIGLDYNRPVRAFGVTVNPGDYILADDDGAVIIPPALAEEIATTGLETERKETFIRQLVQKGVPVSECYPPNAYWYGKFEEWKKEQGFS
ncbi:MAG: ribonuclease activity regulator RraA [Chloroflexota bacterium]